MFFGVGNKDENKMALGLNGQLFLNFFDKWKVKTIVSLKAFNLAHLQKMALEVLSSHIQTPWVQVIKALSWSEEVLIQMVVASKAFGLTYLEPQHCETPLFTRPSLSFLPKAMLNLQSYFLESVNSTDIVEAPFLDGCDISFFQALLGLSSMIGSTLGIASKEKKIHGSMYY
ncbi:hypothetical protein Tco_0849849 [Tanacetum coccineum]